jgi:hypothetical protein
MIGEVFRKQVSRSTPKKPGFFQEKSGKNRINGRQDAYPTLVFGDV